MQAHPEMSSFDVPSSTSSPRGKQCRPCPVQLLDNPAGDDGDEDDESDSEDDDHDGGGGGDADGGDGGAGGVGDGQDDADENADDTEHTNMWDGRPEQQGDAATHVTLLPPATALAQELPRARRAPTSLGRDGEATLGQRCSRTQFLKR